MSKIKYKDINFRPETLEIIARADSTIEEYLDNGFNLTLRQLYYQFVAGDYLPSSWADPKTGSTNNEKSYKKLGSIINNARLAGLIRWDAIIDRTREVKNYPSWEGISDILYSASDSFSLDKWDNQDCMVEVWVEKDALIDVVKQACDLWEVPHFSCRGYISQSAMWRAASRIENYRKSTTIFYLGDHDPSGIDMVRDIRERLDIFGVEDCVVDKIALTQSQIEEYSPPPNPTKVTDSRAKKYIQEYGHECWELDALEPGMLVNLISGNIELCIDEYKLDDIKNLEKIKREQIKQMAEDCDE